MYIRVLEVYDWVEDPLGIRRADFSCLYQVGKVLGEGVGGTSRVRGYGGGHSRSVACLEMAYRGL